MVKKLWNSKITKVKKDKLTTHGIDQEEIINNFRYEEMVFLLIFGRKPTAIEADLFRAVIVSHVSHGITGQSTIAVCMGADCRSPFLNSALGGFLVGSGGMHQGALQLSMEMIKEAAEADDLKKFIQHRLTTAKILHGYGHRFHTKDPRAVALMKLCAKHNAIGKYVQIAKNIEKLMIEKQNIYMNIEGAGAAILLDLGIQPEIASLIILLGRTPMYAAIYLERLHSGSKPFQELVVYDVTAKKKK